MAQTTLLPLLRRISFQNLNLHKATDTLFRSHLLTTRHLSSLPSPQANATTSSASPSDTSKRSSLSARMSFVFDQIDAIERERSQKDETLQRIRAWRESKRNKNLEDSKTDNNSDGVVLGSNGLRSSELSQAESGSVELETRKVEKREDGLLSKQVELIHPWPEWIELMERLVQQNYFDHRRKDEDKMIEDLGFQLSEVADEGFDFTRDWKTVQTACLNFGRDRFDILRSLSRQDIQILVGYGCPSADKKVVFSAKLLRKHAHLDEGDVCSSCSLRNSCEKAYLLTNKEDEARTIDVMRVLLTYGFDPVNGSVVNEPLLKIKSVKTVVRKLLHEVVKLSAVPIDPNLPPPVIKKPPPKVKQPPPPPKKRVGRDDIEMKRGDWLCPKCDFMNFAKNVVCLQCDAKRPKRQLLPGEWECPKCNFLNYRRNMVCFNCEHKRPPDEYTENEIQGRQRAPKIPNRAEVSDAWNFDFDDNESDGADVAAFEHANSHKLDEDFPQINRAQGENLRRLEDTSYATRTTSKVHRRELSDPGHGQSVTGFNDFDDEDDDIDSYELDTHSYNQQQKSSSIDFSEIEGDSETEDIEGFNEDIILNQTSSSSRNKPFKQMSFKEAEQDFDSDDEFMVHPSRKSSHVANSRHRSRGRGAISYGSDEDYGLSSGADDFVDERLGSRQNNKGEERISNRKGTISYGSDEDYGLSSRADDFVDKRLGSRYDRGYQHVSNRRDSFDLDSNDEYLPRRERYRSGHMSSERRKPFNDEYNRSSRAPRGNNRRTQRDNYGRHRMKDTGDRFQNFRHSSKEQFGSQRRRGFNDYDNRSDKPRDFDDERHRRPRTSVP